MQRARTYFGYGHSGFIGRRDLSECSVLSLNVGKDAGAPRLIHVLLGV